MGPVVQHTAHIRLNEGTCVTKWLLRSVVFGKRCSSVPQRNKMLYEAGFGLFVRFLEAEKNRISPLTVNLVVTHWFGDEVIRYWLT